MTEKSEKIRETDLYIPVKKYFERKGFVVKSEVLSCDIVAVKNDTVVVIELKRNFNVKLLYQAIERQKITDFVYVVVPKPKKFGKTEKNDIINLLTRLGIGLIVVSFGQKRTLVQNVIEPSLYKQRAVLKKGRGKKKVLKEFYGRNGDFNIGGSVGKKLVTSYREKSIFIACVLEVTGAEKTTVLSRIGCDNKNAAIMRNNFYGWFENISRGVYGLTDKWYDFCGENEYFDVIEFYRKEAQEKCLIYQETTSAGAAAAKNIKYATKEAMNKT